MALRQVADLPTPAFLVDKGRFERNCQKMERLSKDLGLNLRCHIKTHKTREGAVMQTSGTCRKVVCSTLPEVELLEGFDDILYGVPLCPSKLERCHDLKEKIPLFHILLDNAVALEKVEEFHKEHGGKKWSVYVKINTGANRAGLAWDDSQAVDFALKVARSKATELFGLYVHDGHLSYGGNKAEVQSVARNSISKLLTVVKQLEEHGVTKLEYGIGCTPSCSNPTEALQQITEIHPGNYAFYDAQQFSYGNCREDEIACSVLTRVIGHYPERNEMIIDAGFTATTKQGTDSLPGGNVLFRNHPELRIRGQTQEIGIVDTNNNATMDYSKYPIGSSLELFPYHSCATAAMFEVYYIREDDSIIGTWKPAKFW